LFRSHRVLQAFVSDESSTAATTALAEGLRYALNDSMWKKYRIAATFSLPGRAGHIGTRNFTRPAWSDLNLNVSPNIQLAQERGYALYPVTD
jgi:hypothetical protein